MLTLSKLDASACVQGDTIGKTIKLPPYLFVGDLIFPGEASQATFEEQ
jgi:hypothetical protein